MKNWIDLVVGLAWPALAGFTLWFFRNELKGLINRLRSAGKGGLEFEPPQQPSPKGGLASAETLPTTEQPAAVPAPDQTGQRLAPHDYITPIYRAFYDQTVDRVRQALARIIHQGCDLRLAGMV